MKDIKVASVQFEHRPGDKEANLAKVRRFAAEAAGQGVRLLVAPEMFLTGYNIAERAWELAEPADGPSAGRAAAIAAAHGFEAMESDELEALVDGLIAENPDEWSRFCGGDDGDRKKMQGFFTGQIMKATRGQADGRAVAELLGRKAGG